MHLYRKYTACHYNALQKDGGISVVAKNGTQSERFFDNDYKRGYGVS
jgi:hypothetical protein